MLIKLLPQQVEATSPVLTKEYSKEPLPLDLGLEKMRFGTEIPLPNPEKVLTEET